MSTGKQNGKETAKAKHAYELYAAQGFDRSLPALAVHLGKKPAYARMLQKWAKQFHWSERLKEYDTEQIEKEKERQRKKKEEEIERMNERHAAIGTTQQVKALEQIKTLMEAKAFGSLAAVQLLRLAIEVERNARGESAIQKLEIGGKDGGPIEIKTTWGTPKVRRDTDHD
jgi:hypothetical protein